MTPRAGRQLAPAGDVALRVAIWPCLIPTLIRTPAGQSILFPITLTMLSLSFGGHLIFGAVLGSG
jgi:hypothetical protein